MIEMKLKEFLRIRPDMVNQFIDFGIDVSDDDYIVRVDFEKHFLEVGYVSDKWMIGGFMS